MLTTPSPVSDVNLRDHHASTAVPVERLPVAEQERPAPRLAYWLSGVLTLAALIASTVGVLFPHVFRDPAMTAGNARGTSLVILVSAIPALVAGMAMTARGSSRGRAVWLGALVYLAYNSVLFAFDTTFNALFLVYVAMLSLGVWSLVALLTQTDARRIELRARSDTLPRAVAVYLLVVAALFALLWLGQIVPPLIANSAPTALQGTHMLTSPVHVLDLGFTLPITALAAIWLWWRKPWGYLLAGGMLVMLTIESASVAVDQWFGHLSDPSASAAMTPVFAVMTLIGLVPMVALLTRLRLR